MTDDHELYVEWAAAYTLGALDAEDRTSFERHLATCGRCAAELVSQAPLVGLLAKVDPAEVAHEPDPRRLRAIEAAAQQELVLMRRRTRRWQMVALAGVAAAGILAVVMFATRQDDAASPVAQPAVIINSVAGTTDITTSSRLTGASRVATLALERVIITSQERSDILVDATISPAS